MLMSSLPITYYIHINAVTSYSTLTIVETRIELFFQPPYLYGDQVAQEKTVYIVKI